MLQRRLRLLQAVSLNMSMMVGIGPFITIPTILTTMGGPQAMVGWVLGALVALADGLVWCELASAFPGSGGTYHFFDAAYGESTVGRSLKFLFVWQFLFSGPLEIATGAIGLAQYLCYFAPGLKQPMWNWGSVFPGWDAPVPWFHLVGLGVMGLVTFLAYRRIEMAGRLVVVLWVGMLATVGWVIVAGLWNFDAKLAFDFPEGAWDVSRRNTMGLGMALAIAMYDFLGYYQICYLGDEVAEPSRTIPRDSDLGRGRRVDVPDDEHQHLGRAPLAGGDEFVVCRQRHDGTDQRPRRGGVRDAHDHLDRVRLDVRGLLGYSRVPYASAKAGHFFRFFAATHPRADFPHHSLLLISGLGMLACLADLGTVIAALLTSRILIQFVGQILTLFVIRSRPEVIAKLKFRMPFYPIPAVVALVGWLFVFGTSQWLVLAYGAGTLGLGVAAFLVWDRLSSRRIDEPEQGLGD